MFARLGELQISELQPVKLVGCFVSYIPSNKWATSERRTLSSNIVLTL